MKDKKCLIFGGSGSLGKALISRLVDNNSLHIFSRDEAKHWKIRTEYSNPPGLMFHVGDIRDYDRVEEVILKTDPDIIIMAAALKQVDTCELTPNESILTNITGIQNIVKAVEKNYKNLAIDTVLMVSTDKACEPLNTYGMCKAVSEKMTVSREFFYGNHPRFICVRYGNVLTSRGSIIPLFNHQASHAESITLTHKDMTRFIMTLDESVDLILHAIKNAISGEIWIPRLKAMRIYDLAKIFGRRSGKEVKTIGIRPGEKMHEALICEPESLRTRDTGTHYVINPSHKEIDSTRPPFSYTSADDVIGSDELEEYLISLGLLTKEGEK
tara:strand:- start:16818 stop:17798 length:981 start_codon:yes stop_codon:yes gene_type:complete